MQAWLSLSCLSFLQVMLLFCFVLFWVFLSFSPVSCFILVSNSLLVSDPPPAPVCFPASVTVRLSPMCYTCALVSPPPLCLYSACSLTSVPICLCLPIVSIPAFLLLIDFLMFDPVFRSWLSASAPLSMFAPLTDLLCTQLDSSFVHF